MREEFEIQGIPISQLANLYGTPLYVYDGDVISSTFQRVRRSLPSSVDIFYSLKANPNGAIVALLSEMGAGAEVSSLAELTIAQEAIGDPSRIIFVGPGKRLEEIESCIQSRIRAIVCESLEEAALVDRLAVRRGTTTEIMLRVNPAFAVKGSRLTMGGVPRQFGVDEEQILAHGQLAGMLRNARLIGFHVYMGTRILDANVVAQNTQAILDLAEKLAMSTGCELEAVDVGGGLGVGYFPGEQDLDIEELGLLLAPTVQEFRRRHPRVHLIMEIGRFLVAKAGIYVTQVTCIKTSRGERFVIVDGGTNHHMAAVGLGSAVHRDFPIRSLSDTKSEPVALFNIAGPLCTPNDILGRRVPLPHLRVGDLIGVFNSGAYGVTASPVYFLSHGYPSEVLVHGGEAVLIRERDTISDILGRQRFVRVGHQTTSRPSA